MTEKHHLYERLQHLHNELHHIAGVDEQTQHLLEQVKRDIQAILDHSGTHEPPPYERLGERLREGIEQLETSHPRVTLFMGQIVEMLANLGI